MPRTQINKSRAIRDAFDKLGAGTKPKQIVAYLAAKKIAVTSHMVSTVKLRYGYSNPDRGRPPSRNGASIDMVLLMKTKELTQGAGSIAAVRAALDRLEELQLRQ